MRIDGFHDLIVVVSDPLKLVMEIVQPGDKLHLRRVVSDHFEAFREDAFDDEAAAVVLATGFCEHMPEADILLGIEPERILVAGFLFTLGIVHIGRFMGAATWERHSLAERAPLSDKRQFVGQRYSSLPSGEGKGPA